MEGSGMVTRCNQEVVTLAGFGGIEKSIMAPPGALNDPRIALNQGAQRESPWLIFDISLFSDGVVRAVETRRFSLGVELLLSRMSPVAL